MNNGGGNGGGSFKVKHGSYAAEVRDITSLHKPITRLNTKVDLS